MGLFNILHKRRIRSLCTISLYSSNRYKEYEHQYILDCIEEDKQNADRSARFNRNLTLSAARENHYDLVAIVNHMGGCCSGCGIHSGRVYSISGKSKIYPQLPEIVKRNGNFHHGCWCFMQIYFEESSISFLGELIDYQSINKRPFKDRRTNLQAHWHQHRYDRIIEEAKESASREFDRIEYELLCKECPDILPKSFGAYRRMKKGNTPGFQKLLQLVKTVEK